MISIAPRRQVTWDWRAAGNFLFGGAGGGFMTLLAVFVATDTPINNILVLIGLALAGLGLFMVWLKIGRPLRFLNVYRNPWTSWMSREAWVANFLFAAGLACLVYGGPIAHGLAALFGLLFLFCQAQILRMARGIPTWRTGAIVPLVLATGLAEGAGLVSLTALGGISLPSWIGMAVGGLAIVRAATMLAYTNALQGGQSPDAVKPGLKTLLWVIVGIGGVAPVILLALPTSGMVAGLVASILVILTGWHMKYQIVCHLGHYQGLALKHEPARGGAAPGTSSRPGWSE